jgi:hypothetical protein
MNFNFEDAWKAEGSSSNQPGQKPQGSNQPTQVRNPIMGNNNISKPP